ncbi:hypothetical protein BD626DRAFT_519818 [Schizophyllum amplum]|uniref:Uncharacterized protein n=1 Tax=Schizophyllum amplum TaxID=97359 RepID=A0A550BUT1_9AGAR|nr:hypothetical protein BD626DRAFT_519818 [Auriculariopsis ampla]
MHSAFGASCASIDAARSASRTRVARLARCDQQCTLHAANAPLRALRARAPAVERHPKPRITHSAWRDVAQWGHGYGSNDNAPRAHRVLCSLASMLLQSQGKGERGKMGGGGEGARGGGEEKREEEARGEARGETGEQGQDARGRYPPKLPVLGLSPKARAGGRMPADRAHLSMPCRGSV